MENNYITIYSRKLAGYLLLKGFKMEDFQKSHKDNERTIFYFYNSSELSRAKMEFDRLKNYKGSIVNICEDHINGGSIMYLEIEIRFIVRKII